MSHRKPDVNSEQERGGDWILSHSSSSGRSQGQGTGAAALRGLSGLRECSEDGGHGWRGCEVGQPCVGNKSLLSASRVHKILFDECITQGTHVEP